MTLVEIANAINSGYTVSWTNTGYKVCTDSKMPTGFGVMFESNQSYVGLQTRELSACFISDKLETVKMNTLDNDFLESFLIRI